MKPLILGESPSRTGDQWWRTPLSGDICVRMAKTLGFVPSASRRDNLLGSYMFMRRKFELDNLFDRFPGNDWPYGLARQTAPSVDIADVTVLLGRRVAEAFGLRELPYHQWATKAHRPTRRSIEVVVVPHPSGLNRIYNDPAEWKKLGLTLDLAIRKANDIRDDSNSPEGADRPQDSMVAVDREMRDGR